VLGSFGGLTVESEQVTLFQGLETEEIVSEISHVVHSGLDLVSILHDDFVNVVSDQSSRSAGLVNIVVQLSDSFSKAVLSFLVEVIDSDSGSQKTVLGVDNVHVSSSFGSKVVDFSGLDIVVKTLFSLVDNQFQVDVLSADVVQEESVQSVSDAFNVIRLKSTVSLGDIFHFGNPGGGSTGQIRINFHLFKNLIF